MLNKKSHFEICLEMLGSNVPHVINVPGPGSQAPDLSYITIANLLDKPDPKKQGNGLMTQKKIVKKIYRHLKRIYKQNLSGDQIAALNRILDDIQNIGN